MDIVHAFSLLSAGNTVLLDHRHDALVQHINHPVKLGFADVHRRAYGHNVVDGTEKNSLGLGMHQNLFGKILAHTVCVYLNLQFGRSPLDFAGLVSVK